LRIQLITPEPSNIRKLLTDLAPGRDGLGAGKRLQTRNAAAKTGGNRGEKDLFCSSDVDGSTEAATARLIAAAPDMYEALNHVEAVLSIVQPRSNTKEYLETLAQVRTALAKAHGEARHVV
jgi:hypothetical protein